MIVGRSAVVGELAQPNPQCYWKGGKPKHQWWWCIQISHTCASFQHTPSKYFQLSSCRSILSSWSCHKTPLLRRSVICRQCPLPNIHTDASTVQEIMPHPTKPKEWPTKKKEVNTRKDGDALLDRKPNTIWPWYFRKLPCVNSLQDEGRNRKIIISKVSRGDSLIQYHTSVSILIWL